MVGKFRFGGFFSVLSQRDHIRLAFIVNSWHPSSQTGDKLEQMSIPEILELIDTVYEDYAGDDMYIYIDDPQTIVDSTENYLELKRQLADLQRIKSILVSKTSAE